MNVLLLLSALLSAITGVTAGGQRAPVAAEQVAARAIGVAAQALAQPCAAMPVVAGFDAAVALRFVAPLVRLPVGTIALYASRRRE